MGNRVKKCLYIVIVLALLFFCNEKNKLEEMIGGNFSYISDVEIKQQLEHIFSTFPDDVSWIYRDINGDEKKDLILTENAYGRGRERILGVFAIEKNDVVTVLWDIVDMTCFYELCDKGVLYYEQYYGVYDNERYTLYRFDEYWDKIFVEGMELIYIEDIRALSSIQMTFSEDMTIGEINCWKFGISSGITQYTKIAKSEWLEKYYLLFGKEYNGEIM